MLQLAINPIICTQLSLTFLIVEAFDKKLGGVELRLREISKYRLCPKGKALVYYCASGGIKNKTLGKFIHRSAQCCGWFASINAKDLVL
jgi:hypothetical protein